MVLNNKPEWKKNTILFLTSQTISLFGSSLVQYAIMWYITLETQSGIMMTISIICGFLPTFFLSPFAGVWADRYNRKRLIILADSMIAISTLILALLFFAGYKMMWLLFVMSAIRALGAAVQMPAVGAFIPQLVPEDKLLRVNGINGSIQSAVMLVSPMLSGALLTFTTIEAIFFIDVITAALGVSVLLFFLHVPAHRKAQEAQTVSYFADMSQGLKYIREHAFLKSFFVFCALFMIMAAPAAFLTPLQVARTFGDDVWRLTAIEMTFSVGMMIGGILMATWGGFKNRIHSMALGTLGFGVCTVALGVIPVFWLYLVFMAFVGVSMPIFNTPATVMLQEKVEPDFLGRVFGILSMISSTMMPLGMLIFGPLADSIAIEVLLIGTGVIMVLESVFLFGNKVLLEAGRPAVKPIEPVN
ncbi:major facilitator superfamily MFS_1 [Desulfitobacterium hafniense DCB-2]|uniref:Major facilitator superfamily MFS_1 n=1 Tax=Desulfitobacterium hafniense (strain DSM 10664 / DCB-2) TaxID=272564 RepID=B8FZV0_DESHD|nr:MFS transporter [Desulfitobacterium hafniense]ACL19174.1 major facilitator superfamily MFS_1 [Desulfitobacterium hafniense DCB-2]